MSNPMQALNEHFYYNIKLARALQQFLTPFDRKMIQLWIDKLVQLNKSLEQMAIRSDYMWFIMLMLQSKHIREPFTKLPPSDILPLKKFVSIMYWGHLLVVHSIFLQNAIYECHVVHRRSSHMTHNDDIEVISTENLEHSTRKPEDDCVPLVSCPAHVRITDNQYCDTKGGRKGVRCTTGQNHTEPISEKNRGHHYIHIDPLTLGAINRKCRTEMSELRSREAMLMSTPESTMLFPGSATYGHFRNSRKFNMADLDEVMSVASSALEIAIATRAFKDRQGITNEQLQLGMVNQDLRATPLGRACASRPTCSPFPEKYRRIDGTCNNERDPSLGAPFTPYSRLLPPSYQDGIWSPRVSVVENQPLPSPREVSNNVISDADIPNSDYTLMMMQFGQFISHDVTQSIDTSYANGSAISCCSQDSSSELPSEFQHYACMPISIPNADAFYGNYKQGCMNFVRSVLAPRKDCSLGYAQQMNKVSHFLDGSTIYGSTPEQTSELRTLQDGQLKVFEDFNRPLLPLAKDPDACLTMEQGSACFQSGDTRTNQHITLVVMHTLFLREHNRVANVLARLNPHWNDEQLFLEARKIVVAEIQAITYKEFLPIIIGENAMDEFGLYLGNGFEYSTDYNANIDPSVTNEFASAAFRFGHSIVDGRLKVFGPQKMEEMIALPEVMFYPSRMRQTKFMDEIVTTLTTEPIQEVDNSVDESLTKYLFRAGNPFGVDLVSINIQRGRDHGIRPYNDYREVTGLPRIKTFEEFGPEMGENLRRTYASVDDIDLWIGGILEPKAPGSLVGPTFRDIIAEQFSRFKKGDRYFFENHPSINPGHFTPEQLQELRKASISRIICQNTDQILIEKMTLNAFKAPMISGNQYVECNSNTIPRINLILWQE